MRERTGDTDEPLAGLVGPGARGPHARHALADQDYDWGAFAAQQAGERVLKALLMARGAEPWGHSLTSLVEALEQSLPVTEETKEAANRLDKHYIPARYPNGFASGFPAELYTRGEAEGAIDDVTRITAFCRSQLPR